MRYTVQRRFIARYGWRWAVCAGSQIIYHTAHQTTATMMANMANPEAPQEPRMLTQAMIDGEGKQPVVLWHNFLHKVKSLGY